MFLTGQNCLFRTLVAVCDPAFELHARVSSSSAREVKFERRVADVATSVRNKQFCPVKNMAHITVKGFIDSAGVV